jgi:hypothetical protein
LALAKDHRVSERRPGLVVNGDGREDVTSGGSVYVPVSQIVDDPRGGLGVERLGNFRVVVTKNSCSTRTPEIAKANRQVRTLLRAHLLGSLTALPL